MTVFSCFWTCPEAGQQVEGGSADPNNLQNPEKKGKRRSFRVPQIEAGLWVVSKYVCSKRGRGWKQESGASGGELNHVTEMLISGAMGGKVKAGQREESEYLLEAGQRLESWKRGKEMHFRKRFWMEKGRTNNKKKEAGEGVELLTVLDSTHVPDSHLACSGHT